MAVWAPSAARDRRIAISALGVVQILAWGSSFYLLTVLAGPIAADTGWPLPWVVAGVSVALPVAGLASPFIGRTIGRRGGRPVLAAAALLLAAGLGLLGLARTLPAFYLAWAVIGLGMGAGLYDAAFATLGRLYREGARSAITTLTLWGGFASTVCWPLSAFMVEAIGWRGACLAYASMHLLVTLPLVLWLVPAASVMPLGPDDIAAKTQTALLPPDRRAVLLLGAIVTTGGFITALVSIHLLGLLQAQGVTLAAAVALGTLIGPSQVGGRIIEMAGGGRHHPFWTMAGAVCLTSLGLALLWAGFPLLAVTLILYGAGNGVFSIARGTLPLALFGPVHYGPLMGMLALPSLLAQAIAPFAGAFLIEHGGAVLALRFLAVVGSANVFLVIALWWSTTPLQR